MERSDDSDEIRSLDSESSTQSMTKVYSVAQTYIPETLKRISSKARSIRSEIFDLNQDYTTDDLNKSLQKDLTVDDALMLQEYISNKTDKEYQLDREQTNVEKIYTNRSTGEIDYPPDGGYGWVCAVCAGAIQFCTWGNNSGFGVFLAYYINSETFPGATEMDFAWIAGLLVFNAQVFAPLAMISVKMIGFKTTMTIACLVHFLAYLLASFATKLWQLYVCQGVIVGMCYSFTSFPAVGTIPTWFLRRRGLASGIALAGTGIGGVFFSLTINAVIERTGDQRWALRMISIVTTVIMLIAIAFIKRRNEVPRQKITWKNFVANLRIMFALRLLKAKRLWFISLWFTFMIFSYTLVVFSYASFARSVGLSAQQASTLTALLNVGQAIGRPSMGLVADFIFGRINYTIMLNVVIVIFILGFWLNVRGFVGLLLCALCFGFTLGVGNVMNGVLIADAFEPEDFAPAWSILNVIMSVFIVYVEVIALALKDNSLSNPYRNTQIFAGLLSFVALLMIIPVREWQIKKQLTIAKADYTKQLEIINDRKILGIESDEDPEVLAQKLEKLDQLLQKTPSGYLQRATHLTKV